jgi:hypothetical protein
VRGAYLCSLYLLTASTQLTAKLWPIALRAKITEGQFRTLPALGNSLKSDKRDWPKARVSRKAETFRAMERVTEYHRRAADCEGLAKEAINDAHRDAILKIAATWRALAEQRERLALAKPRSEPATCGESGPPITVAVHVTLTG